MNRLILSAMLVCSLVLSTFSLGGCNMFAGMGKDMRETGDAITGTPVPDAYHQSARDF